MKLIPLTQGKFSKVDDDDFDELNKYNWCYNSGYAVRAIRISVGKRSLITMHRVILKTPAGLETDHIDGDKLNNQRINLRVCTTSQNQRNRGVQKNNTSGYKGVWQDRGKWVARIEVLGIKIHLGTFPSPEVAALAYDEAAKKYFGEFAKLNF